MGKSRDEAAETGPGPFISLVLAGVALRGGGRLLRLAVDRSLPATKPAPATAAPASAGRKVTQSLIGTALVRMATRSVPGAILVGGGLLAKFLYDRRKRIEADQAEQPGG